MVDFAGPPAAQAVEAWGDLRLQVTTYLTGQEPALDAVTSVRAIVLCGAEVVVVRDPTREHILPGGRREPGEALEQTLRREVLEETGWEIGPPRLLGVLHFHHLTARPAGYAYPYPDFLQLIYVAAGVRCRPEAQQAGGYEVGSELRPVEAVRGLALTASERVLLAAAVADN